MINIINNKIKNRQSFLNIYENSWNEDKDDYDIDEPKEIDELGDEILNLLKTNHENLPVDFVLESLIHLGFDVSLIYDNNGHFAIPTSSYGSVSSKISDYSSTYFVEKEECGSTIKEAISIFFNNINQ
jgi:hypothetical protein